MANNQLQHTDILDDYDLSFGTDRDIRCRYDEATDNRLEWHDGTNILAYLSDLGTTGMFGVTGRIECPQIGISADTDLLALALNALTVNGTVTASADTDSIHVFGRAKFASHISDIMYLSHFDQAADGNSYVVAQDNTGGSYINCKTAKTISVRVASAEKFNVSSSGVTMADASNILFNGTTGTKLGTATTQKIGFWNATPIVQPASANQAALTNSTAGTYDGTLAAMADLTDSPASADALRDDIVTNLLPVLRNNFTDIFTLLDAMRTAMVNSGLMKGAA